MSGPADPSPGLLHSLQAFALLDGRGDLELTREARGANVEWGGVYGQLVRLTGPWRLRVEADGVAAGLPESCRSAGYVGERFRSSHVVGAVAVAQTVAPLPAVPGVVRSLRLTHAGTEPRAVTVTSLFEPFLLPVLVEGIRPIDYRLETRPDELRVRHRGFGLAFRATVAPSRLYVDRASWRGGRLRGAVDEIASEHELLVPPGSGCELRFGIVGGLERDLEHAAGPATSALPDAEAAGEISDRDAATWQDGTPELRFPDAPDLEQGYRLARTALRRLYCRPGDELTGLVAGYPWYASIWCRDLAWMLPAVIWLGDYAWAADSLDSVFRFQAGSDVALVGAELGELPMQISPGPIFLFGSSDTTLYYPALVRRLVHHTGDTSLAGRWALPVGRAIGWAEQRTDPATGLLRHGGEAAALAAATRAVARVRYGIDAPDTTIWDSADRRDHALDVQVLWLEAIRAAVELGTGGDAAALEGMAARLAGSVGTLYAWPEEGYLFDSRRDGRGVAEVRPNALRAVSAGLIEPERARAIVRRAAADDLTTPWGLRTLSARDAGYVPTAYHGGQVWTIATVWAADAAYAAGEPELGLGYLRCVAARLAAEAGGANECYHGDRAEAFDSCFLLGFSVAPFVSALFERLWGLEVDGRIPSLGIRPRFPASWRSAAVERLRVAGGRASISFADGRITVAWSGPRPLAVVTTGGRATIAPGASATVDGAGTTASNEPS